PGRREPDAALRRPDGGRRRAPRVPAGGHHRPDRPERRRQDHAVQPADRVRQAQHRGVELQRPPDARAVGPQGRPGRHGADVPADQGAVAPDGHGEHEARRHGPDRRALLPVARAGPVAQRGGGDRGAGRGPARAVQPEPHARRVRRGALRRPAQAARDGPGAHGRARARDARRAHGRREPGPGPDHHRPRPRPGGRRPVGGVRRARHGRRPHGQRLGRGHGRGPGDRRGEARVDRRQPRGHPRLPRASPRHPARPGRAGAPARRGPGRDRGRARGRGGAGAGAGGGMTATDTHTDGAGQPSDRTPLLEARELVAGYVPEVNILNGVDLTLYEGELVGVIGPNGAGKSTLIKALFGLIPVRSGTVVYGGEDVTGRKAHSSVAKGIGYEPQTNIVFPRLTVEENLQMGLYLRPRQFAERFEAVTAMFPRLAERRKQRSGSLSGGERQMLAMGRALMMDPKVLLLDEPSAGLSPAYQDEVFINCRRINEAGVSIVMVEQNANRCLQICHRGYVLDQGRNAYTDTGRALLSDPKVIELYLGTLAQV